jgi:hypothetical protein
MLLNQLRPPMYRYLRSRSLPAPEDTRMADHGRIGYIPVGPDFTEEEIAHAVLGVVKTAEYVGVRFWTSPERAASYAQRMIDKYGPDHDAYRPVFPVPKNREVTIAPAPDPASVTVSTDIGTIAED